MKFRLIYPALILGSVVMLPSCSDDNKDTQAQPKEVSAQPKKLVPPSQECVVQALTAAIEEFPFLALGDVAPDFTENADGSVSVSAKVTLKVKENLMQAQQAPAAFKEERKVINDAANKAMQPESLYLLQIGAPAEMLTDEDRTAKPLPENLQPLANALKELSDGLVYSIQTPEGTTIETTATMKAVKGAEKWEISDIILDQTPMSGMSSAIRQSTLPEGAALLSDELINARKEEIKQKVAQFNELAHAYILTREESARATYTEHQAKVEEENRKAEAAAAAATAEKEAWEAVCQNFVASGKSFAGEWHRGNRFGELTLFIEKAERFENSIQFFGALFDTKLPEASLEVAGRCIITPQEDGTSHIDVTIYDGQYDPDQPTAEVYDAQDGMLSLSLGKDGALKGIMGCTAWGNASDKNFSISLTPKATAAKSSAKSPVKKR